MLPAALAIEHITTRIHPHVFKFLAINQSMFSHTLH
jgi:hypothetical protein